MATREGQRKCFEKLKSVGLFAQFEKYEDFEKNQRDKKEKKQKRNLTNKNIGLY